MREHNGRGLGRVDLYVRLEGRANLSGQVYRQIREAIVDGRLRPPDVLPSIREMARLLSVSRNTVTAAYDRLTAEGLVASRVGVGVFVTRDVGSSPVPQARCALHPRPLWDHVEGPSDAPSRQPEFEFRSGIPDAAKFPFATWRALLAQELRSGASSKVATGDPLGHPGLRAAMARHLGVSRLVQVDAEDVCVTNGAQQAIDLVARLLVEPGDVVAVEDPGHPLARQAFRAHGAQVSGVPVDAEGLVVDALPADARLVYVTPSHQYPLGITMSHARRRRLLDWAEKTGAAIVEDDCDSEFRLGRQLPAPLHRLDETGRVLYVGSFSRILLPTLRLGYLIVTPTLRSALRKAKRLADGSTSEPLQAATARFIEEGQLTRHIRRMRGIYAARHHLVRVALADEFGDHVEVVPSSSGMRLAALLRRHGDDRAIVAAAAHAGVAVEALSDYAMSAAVPPGLLIGYGAVAADRVGTGLRRLRSVIDELGTDEICEDVPGRFLTLQR